MEKELDTCVQEEYQKRMERRSAGGGPIRHGRGRVPEDDGAGNNNHGEDVEPRSSSVSATHSPGPSLRGKSSVRGGRGGFVPKARVKT